MRRGTKPSKAKAKLAVARRSPENEGSRVRDLEKRLAEARGQLQTRDRELVEALEQQTATSEILRVISSSPTDVQPVFETILESATRLCTAENGILFRYDDGAFYTVACRGLSPEAETAFTAQPVRPGPHSGLGRMLAEKRPIQVADVTDDIAYRQGDPLRTRTVTLLGARTAMWLPLLKSDAMVGAMAIYRRDVRPFTAKQIALVGTFADQAVIAIENVRLFNETKEALERQTATAEVLRVISSSPTAVQPVFDSIVASATRLCEGLFSAVYRYDGNLVHLVAHHNFSPAALTAARQAFPMAPSRGGAVSRALLTREVVHIPDLRLDPEYAHQALARDLGFPSILAVPMLRDGVPIGAIAVAGGEAAPFSDKQITLLKTFADQAVIAIENVRLFTELQEKKRALTDTHAQVTEALEQQTATAEILRVISQSQTDVQPVFDAIADSALRLLGASAASVARYEGEMVSLMAARGGLPGSGDAATERFGAPHPPRPGPEQALLSKAVHHVVDVEADASCGSEFRRHAVQRGIRSFLAVPMLQGGNVLGMIVVSRPQPGGFSTADIALLQTFADQAAIAIENVRLFQQLQARTAALTRSVDQLTALGEVSRAVSSTLDLATVLTTIVSRAVELSGLDGGLVSEYDQTTEEFVQRATAEIGESLPQALREVRYRKGEGAIGRTAITRAPVQVADITIPGMYESRVRETLIESGVRAVLAIPMIHQNRLIGCLGVTRKRPGEFPAETIELLRTFATQSALAIQNARLFQEIADKSRQLEAASQHKSEFLANMSHELRTPLNAVIGFSEVLRDRMFGDLNDKQEEYLNDIYTSGQHLLSLINDILDLSKIEAGRMELELTDFHLQAALDNALILVRERAGRHGIALHAAIDSRIGYVWADERKIKQVLLNLLSNAIKFTPEGGRIDVRAISASGSVEVSVTDTGVGIAPQDQEAIFEEFRQVGTASKKVEGTGLGLALSRKFVELHGGRIWVQSKVGEGSMFTFTIPVRRAE